MKLEPVPINEIPIGTPLPWRIYDSDGYIVFELGEVVSSREQLLNQFSAGLLRNVNVEPVLEDTATWHEFREAPIGTFPPAGIKPHAGERLQIRLLQPGQTVGYHSARLIGYIRNKSILVTRPSVTGGVFLPIEGAEVEVRMVTGNNIYAFQSTIQRLCISPAQYMHLDYPTEVRVQKLRKSPWARANIGVTITDAQGGREAGRLLNLSSDGGQLQAPPTIGNPGKDIRIAFHATMDELKTTLTLDATILHVHPHEERGAGSNLIEFGIAFHNLAFADSLWLKALVYRHIAEGDLA